MRKKYFTFWFGWGLILAALIPKQWGCLFINFFLWDIICLFFNSDATVTFDKFDQHEIMFTPQRCNRGIQGVYCSPQRISASTSSSKENNDSNNETIAQIQSYQSSYSQQKQDNQRLQTYGRKTQCFILMSLNKVLYNPR